MRRIILVTFMVLVVSAIILSGCGEPAAPTTPTEPTTPAEPTTPTEPTTPEVKPTEWRFATFIPGGESQTVKTVEWAERLEEATGGRLKITFYVGGSLIKPGGEIDAIEAGTADLGCILTSGKRERFPLTWVTTLPMLFTKGTGQAAWTWMSLYNKYEELRNEYLPTTKVLWAQNPGATNIDSNRPVQTLEDLKGLKIDTGNPYEVEGYKSFGAVPVDVETSEEYHALETGVIDATSDDWTAVWTWKLYETTRYRTDGINWLHHAIPVIINVESYNKLPEDIKRIFDELTPAIEMSKDIGEYHWAVQAENIEKIKEHDNKVGNPPWYVLPEAEHQRWVDGILPVREQWSNEMEEKGFPGNAMLADAIAFAEQYK